MNLSRSKLRDMFSRKYAKSIRNSRGAIFRVIEAGKHCADIHHICGILGVLQSVG